MKIFETKEFAEITVNYSTKVKKADRVAIKSSTQSASVFRAVFDFNANIEHKEYCYALYMNKANEIIGVNKISEGGIDATVVDMAIIFQAGILVGAKGIILCHNHPTGNLTASEQDDKLTERIIDGGKLLGINVFDHIILTAESYYSYADNSFFEQYAARKRRF